jgi:hypothetical protein
VIDYDERNRLLRELRIVSGFDEIIAKFEAADSGAPLRLNLVERFRLRVALEVWQDNGELPEGLARLLATIVQADPRGHHGKPHHGV